MRKKLVIIIFFLIVANFFYWLFLTDWQFLIFKMAKKKLASSLVKEEVFDLDKDLKPEKYRLQNGRLKVSENALTIWQSPNNWWIDDFALADSTNDGVIDINLSVWKRGNYGRLKPFWIKENDQSIKNHFFVFNFAQEKIRPIWQSSNLDKPNCQFRFEDVNNDKQQELIVLEGDYSDDWRCQGKYVAVWQWKNWGFFNAWRSPAAEFENLKKVVWLPFIHQ